MIKFSKVIAIIVSLVTLSSCYLGGYWEDLYVTPGSKSFNYKFKVIGEMFGKTTDAPPMTMSLVANLAIVNALTKSYPHGGNIVDSKGNLKGSLKMMDATVGDLLATLCLTKTTLPAFGVLPTNSSYNKICSEITEPLLNGLKVDPITPSRTKREARKNREMIVILESAIDRILLKMAKDLVPENAYQNAFTNLSVSPWNKLGWRGSDGYTSYNFRDQSCVDTANMSIGC